MNLRLARQLLIAYRPSGEDDHERDVKAALKIAAKNAELGPVFANQLAFDRALADRLDETSVPESTAEALAEVARRFEAKRGRKFSFRDPAVLAAGLAFLFLIGLLAWILMGQMGSFAGVQEVAEMVAAGDKAGPESFKEIDTHAGSLADWFVMQDFEGYALPPEMAGAPVVGVRLFKFDDVPVAVAAIAKPPAFLYVFDAAPFGLSLPANQWRVAAFGPGLKRAFAVRQVGAMAVAVALHHPPAGEPGNHDRQELEAYLQSLKPAP